MECFRLPILVQEACLSFSSAASVLIRKFYLPHQKLPKRMRK